jgi:phage gp45-like
MPNAHLFDEQVGLLRTGSIFGYDPVRGLLKVKLNNTSSIKGQGQSIDVPAPHTLFYNNGLFIGTLPVSGTPVVVGQGSGGQYYFVSFLAENLPAVPALNLGELLIRANDTTKISLQTSNDIILGSDNNKIHINTKNNLITTNFHNENHFTQASRSVNGIIKRDLRINTNYDSDSKLENDSYDSKLFVIGLDPSVSPNPVITGSNKNPPFVEQRDIVYEFQHFSEVNDELSESLLYGDTKPPATSFFFPNRRTSRADTLSLTLAAPNYLMETIKGTVVDIFGNILDINRVPIPIGKEQNTIKASTSTDKVKSYLSIRELERKSIAFHFEINARKNLLNPNGTITLPDINSNEDYARNRSRFFIDIDKEGMLKLNVPASSEKGNVPLLTRYENYSTFGTEDNSNPNKLIFRDDNLDIFQDSFASSAFNINDGSISTDRGSITLENDNSPTTPLDRITQSHIKHGTAYHDILATCYVHQKPDFLQFVADSSNPTFSKQAIASLPLLKDVASKKIIVGGDNANAGGRSGSLNFDGSVELNIGANTVDRQSLWMDLAGGMVANVGRDIKNMSAALSLNGDVFVQVGGLGVSTDSRFVQQMNGHIGAVLDIRVFNSGLRATMIRIDDEGVKILTPGNLSIHSGQDLRITADGDIAIDCETLTLQNRMVMKEFGGSI